MFNSDNSSKQAELFNDLPGLTKKPRKRKFSLGKVAISLSYENLIIMIIAIIMLFIISYSLGVEKGKHLVVLKKDNLVEETPHIQERVEKKPLKRSPQPLKKKKTRTKFASQYTIQVATFRKSVSVQQEMERLKNKGYQPFVINRGKFSEICVGSYSSKNAASVDLAKLRKIYADCFLRNKSR
jgi:hypothetical protein